MFETYADLVDYFQTDMLAAVTDLKGVTVGADEEILNLQNSRIRYPHLWVETPDVGFRGTDHNPAKRFRFSLVVLTNEPAKTNAAANAALSAMLTLAEQVWAQLLADADAGDFDLVLDEAGGQPVRAWSGDNGYGWRLEPVSIDLPRCECEDCP